jgi:hypothetical protein
MEHEHEWTWLWAGVVTTFVHPSRSGGTPDRPSRQYVTAVRACPCGEVQEVAPTAGLTPIQEANEARMRANEEARREKAREYRERRKAAKADA